jgi:hypothetical protein
MRTLILVSSATAVLAACASPWHEQVVALPEETLPTSGFSSLTLIPTDNPSFAYRALSERVPAVLSVWSTDETAVRDTCDAREPRGNNGKESPAVVLVPSANQYVLWRPALADAKVEEAMQSYARVTVQDARRPFYGDPERRNLEPAWRCFRFTRFVNRDDDAPALDFVGQLRLGDSGDYVQVRPLRLYVAPGAARHLAIGLRLEAVWRQGNVGKMETVFEPVLLAMRLKPSVEELHYFLDKYWEHYPILPVVPVSMDARGRLVQTAPATVTVTAVEFRKPDSAKEALLRTARGAGDHLSALIVAALTAH